MLRLPSRHFMDFHLGWQEPVELLENPFSDIFRGGICLAKGRQVVQILMVKAVEKAVGDGLGVSEVDDHPQIVEPVCSKHDIHFPVVAVQPLAASLVTAQLVRSGKMSLVDKFVHGRIFQCLGRVERAMEAPVFPLS